MDDNGTLTHPAEGKVWSPDMDKTQTLAAQNVTYMSVLDPQGHTLRMYPQVLQASLYRWTFRGISNSKNHLHVCVRHVFNLEVLFHAFTFILRLMEKLHWPFFSLLDFCGKPKPSTEFCVQLLGFARVWSRSAAPTPSYVHVSDSTSWQRVTDAAYRGWRCSATVLKSVWSCLPSYQLPRRLPRRRIRFH